MKDWSKNRNITHLQKVWEDIILLLEGLCLEDDSNKKAEDMWTEAKRTKYAIWQILIRKCKGLDQSIAPLQLSIWAKHWMISQK